MLLDEEIYEVGYTKDASGTIILAVVGCYSGGVMMVVTELTWLHTLKLTGSIAICQFFQFSYPSTYSIPIMG